MMRNGYSYIEILVAVALIALALPPALDALGTQLRGAGQNIKEMQIEYRLLSRMDELMTEPFSALQHAAKQAGGKSTPTSYSDPAGTENRLIVYMANYDFQNTDADGDPFTNPNVNVLWIRVEVEGSNHYLDTARTWY